MIGELVRKLIASGADPAIAAEVVTQAFASGASSSNGSGGIPAALANRRKYDRERKQAKKSGGIPVDSADSGGIPQSPPQVSPQVPLREISNPSSPTSSPPCSLRSHSGGREATRPSESHFLEFWKAYPRRDGSNPRAPAEKKFAAIVKSGTDPTEIIAAAGRYAAEMRAKCQERTPFVTQAMTWLSQRRWGDYAELPLDADKRGMVRVMPDTAQWEAWRRFRGKPLPVDRDGGWWCPSEWPGGLNGQGSGSEAAG